MRVYVAGGFVFRDRIRAIQAAVRAAGHTISHDWTAVEEDAAPSPQDLTRYSDLDINTGVRTAHAVVALFNDPAYPYRGTFAEIGAAIALEIPIIIIDELGGGGSVAAGPRRVPFFHDGNVLHVHSVAEAVEAVNDLGDQMERQVEEENLEAERRAARRIAAAEDRIAAAEDRLAALLQPPQVEQSDDE